MNNAGPPYNLLDTVPRDPRDESRIVLRVSRGRKAAYVRAAKPGTLAGWIFVLLDKASGFKKDDQS